jgi:hypothetical protein
MLSLELYAKIIDSWLDFRNSPEGNHSTIGERTKQGHPFQLIGKTGKKKPPLGYNAWKLYDALTKKASPPTLRHS